MSIVPQPEFPRIDLNRANAIILPEVIDIPAINGLAREHEDYQLPLFQLAHHALSMNMQQPYNQGDFRAFTEGLETIPVIAFTVNNGAYDPRIVALRSWREYVKSAYSDSNILSDRIHAYSNIKPNTFDTVLRIGQRYPVGTQSLRYRMAGAQIGDELQGGEYRTH